uniref:Transcription termination factor Rho n=1 Tax=Caenorhabditis tropicalis TaxID=1561998 RepID=A0A1I7THG0_9PELO
MSNPGGHSENTDPNGTNTSEKGKEQQKSGQRQNQKKQISAEEKEKIVTRPQIANPLDLKQLSAEVRRLSDSGKLFNVMKEIERRGGLNGFQGYCMSRGRRGIGRGRRGGGKKEEEVALDQPSTSRGTTH